MFWTKPLCSFTERFLDRAFCVAAAALGAQGPEFMQQYLQRLGGQLDEGRRQLESWRQVARSLGLSLEELISRYGANADPAVVRGGTVVHNLVARVEELAATETALRQASLWMRPWVFLRHLDWGTAQATWAAYRPALPTTLEGLSYAAAGLVMAIAFYHGLIRPVARRCARQASAPNLPKTSPQWVGR